MEIRNTIVVEEGFDFQHVSVGFYGVPVLAEFDNNTFCEYSLCGLK